MKTFKLLLFLLVVTMLIQLSSCSDDAINSSTGNNNNGNSGNGNNSHEYTPADDFVTTWQTDNVSDYSSNETSITIPAVYGSVACNYDVDWNNDGVFDEFNITEDVTHDYGVAGTYTIRIRGEFPAFYFNFKKLTLLDDSRVPSGDNYKLLSVDQWGSQQWKILCFAFCKNFNIQANDTPDLTKVTLMTDMFLEATSFNSPLENWDVSNAQFMIRMFYNATSFNQSIETWNVSKVIKMSEMFSGASSFNKPIGKWNVSLVEDFSFMFADATAFNQDISDWNVGKSTTMLYMFSGASSFNQPIGKWNVTNVSHMTNMFAFASSFNQSIENWNISNVRYLKCFLCRAESFSTTNYDNLLTGWAQRTLNTNVSIDVDTQYCSTAASTARDKLINTYNWSINDNGRDAACQ